MYLYDFYSVRVFDVQQLYITNMQNKCGTVGWYVRKGNETNKLDLLCPGIFCK
jgi:hypothetical protein